MASGNLQPGEDVVEPTALFLAPLVANAFYTLGWLVELLVELQMGPSPKLGRFLFKLGLGFSLFVISVPAVFWGGFRAIQLIHLGQ
jgi:hypothetical protein